MLIHGYIGDAVDKKRLPGATVELWFNNVLIDRVKANYDGAFRMETTSVPNKLKVSHVGYLTLEGEPPTDGVEFSIGLKRDERELGEVIVTAVKKNPGAFIAGGLLLLLLLTSKDA